MVIEIYLWELRKNSSNFPKAKAIFEENEVPVFKTKRLETHLENQLSK